jgi:cation:H+ antiporter
VLLLTFSLAVIYNPMEGERLQGEMSRGIALIPLLVYGVYMFLQQQDAREYDGGSEESGHVSPGREWLALLFSLALILLGVEALVRAAIRLGDLLGTPSFIWGLTVIAVVTSLPDTFVSVRLARRGEGVVSLSNVLGSNIFDLLVAVPAGVLIAGATPVDFGVAAPLMGMLTVATIVLFAMMRTDLLLDRREAKVLLLAYAIFLAWVVLESLGVTGVT